MAKGKPGRSGGDGPASGASKTGNPSGKNSHKSQHPRCSDLLLWVVWVCYPTVFFPINSTVN